jgi:hypothetical protein
MKLTLLLAALGAWPALATWQASPPCLARLMLHEQDGLLHITSSCRSQSPQAAQYRYELHTQRAGRAGQSTTTQGGRFELPPGQEVTLSQINLNAGADAHYRLHLLVYDATGHAVAQDSASR